MSTSNYPEEYTTSKYIVAGQFPSGIWNLYSGCKDLQSAIKDFVSLCEFDNGSKYKAAAVFTRGQWHGSRNTYRRHKNLRNRQDEPIPPGVGMWIINQADSGYF